MQFYLVVLFVMLYKVSIGYEQPLFPIRDSPEWKERLLVV